MEQLEARYAAPARICQPVLANYDANPAVCHVSSNNHSLFTFVPVHTRLKGVFASESQELTRNEDQFRCPGL